MTLVGRELGAQLEASLTLAEPLYCTDWTFQGRSQDNILIYHEVAFFKECVINCLSGCWLMR